MRLSLTKRVGRYLITDNTERIVSRYQGKYFNYYFVLLASKTLLPKAGKIHPVLCKSVGT